MRKEYVQKGLKCSLPHNSPPGCLVLGKQRWIKHQFLNITGKRLLTEQEHNLIIPGSIKCSCRAVKAIGDGAGILSGRLMNCNRSYQKLLQRHYFKFPETLDGSEQELEVQSVSWSILSGWFVFINGWVLYCLRPWACVSIAALNL